MSHTCPLCGSTDVDFPLTILEDRGMVAADGKFVLLTRKEVAVLSGLAAGYPKVVSREQLLSNLYALEHEEAEIKIIDVFVCKIRKKLRHLGVEIINHWGNGYSLSMRATICK